MKNQILTFIVDHKDAIMLLAIEVYKMRDQLLSVSPPQQGMFIVGEYDRLLNQRIARLIAESIHSEPELIYLTLEEIDIARYINLN